jgi:anti-sigma regulatory factor (Ser/Thr protein kinase)
MTGPAFTVSVADGSAVSEARRLARMVAADVGLPETDVERAAIIATEASTNLVKHARGGEIVVRPNPGEAALDIVSIDGGPGMANFAECLRDGFTTTGTRGNGLGAIVRQSDRFDVYSRVGAGTVLVSRIGRGRPAGAMQVDGLSLKMRGETACGDNWTVRQEGPTYAILVADGLGHGEIAATAADAAVAAFDSSSTLAPVTVIDRVHRGLMHTRGAAVAAARIDTGTGSLTYAGVGNISATIEGSGDARHLVSLHGTAGHQVRRLQEFTYPWTADDLLVMHSDGVTAHWTLKAYPGLKQRDALTIAAVLLRDFSRGRDDATVVVAKPSATADAFGN